VASKVDDDGNATAYHYDAFGALSGVDVPDGPSVDYVLDGQTRRVGKKVSAVKGIRREWAARAGHRLDGSRKPRLAHGPAPARLWSRRSRGGPGPVWP
jgi:YD repeat-containing protein